MKPMHMLRLAGIIAFIGITSLAIPQPAHAGVRIAIGLGLPILVPVLPAPPVVVQPAPVVIAPSPVFVPPAPVVVAGPPVVIAGPWRYYHRRPWRPYRRW